MMRKLKSCFHRLLLYPVAIILLPGLCNTLANVPGGGSTGPDVTAYMARKNVVLDNGIVKATIDPNSAAILSLRYRGHEMVAQRGHKTIYFSMFGDVGEERMSSCVFSIKQRSSDMMDVSCKQTYTGPGSKMLPCDVDIHYVLRRGMSGVYVYVILGHPASYPALGTGPVRMIWSMPASEDEWLMEKIYVDSARHWELPSPFDFSQAEPTGIKEIMKLTTGGWAGKYDCKYMYSAPYWDLGCWGFASDRNKVGAWVVFGSHEFFNDGPTKSDLTAAASMIQLLFNMIHYNGSGLGISQGVAWQKIYGPCLFYCNYNTDGGDACWADAQQQAKAEQAAWPYAWLTNEKVYPLKGERGGVTGNFVVTDSLKPNVSGAGAWVGLNQAPGGNWQFDGTGYQYWVHADANGHFSIPNVRPGSYTFSAFTTGAVGEFAKSNVTVEAGETADLGDVAWHVPHPGASIAWEIGVPDRSAGEFRHGDDYFQPYLWTNFANEFPNPLEYTVGVSDWSKDWNYVQCGYPQGTNWSPWKWRIHFNLTNAPANGNATLTIAYAGSDSGRTEIYVNDESKMLTMVRPPVDGGNALIREGIHAKYCFVEVPIPMTLLKRGANTMTLVQGGDRYQRPFFHVMYDYLSLELPPGEN